MVAARLGLFPEQLATLIGLDSPEAAPVIKGHSSGSFSLRRYAISDPRHLQYKSARQLNRSALSSRLLTPGSRSMTNDGVSKVKTFYRFVATLGRLPGDPSTGLVHARRTGLVRGVAADRLEAIERIAEHALAVFDDESVARRWFGSQIRSLGDRRPVECLDTDAGRELVLDTLGAIEYGHVM